jgi:hypothetical protein
MGLFGQQPYDLEPVGIGQGFEKLEQLLVVFFPMHGFALVDMDRFKLIYINSKANLPVVICQPITRLGLGKNVLGRIRP